MPAKKRPAGESLFKQIVKRSNSNGKPNDTQAVAVVNNNAQNGALIQSQAGRTSGLQFPATELTGHTAEVWACRFDPTGAHIASASSDRNILLWRTFGQCENYGILSGHKNAVLDLQWSRDSRVVFSASADQTIASWDVETGQRIRRHTGHEAVINCLDASKRGFEVLASGSDDGSMALWDPRQKEVMDFIETHYPITAVALSEVGTEVFTAGVDPDIKVWDIRNKKTVYKLQGHTELVSSLVVSPDSTALLSFSHDNTARTWDIKPFAPKNRAIKTYEGAQRGREPNLYRASWDHEGKKIAAGGGDEYHSVTIWDVATGQSAKMTGHKGSVNDVRFHPKGDPIVVSASSDTTLILGELPAEMV